MNSYLNLKRTIHSLFWKFTEPQGAVCFSMITAPWWLKEVAKMYCYITGLTERFREQLNIE